jgi:hypothetical protein
MTEEKSNSDDKIRTIVLMYAMFENGSPCWVFVAVKPSQYQPFLAAHKAGQIDLYDFKQYGEIIVSGSGKSPPDDVTLKVAEMYQTDPNTLFKRIKEEQEQHTHEQPKGSTA